MGFFAAAVIGAVAGNLASAMYPMCEVRNPQSLLGTVTNPVTGQLYGVICLARVTGFFLLGLFGVTIGLLAVFGLAVRLNDYLNTHAKVAVLFWVLIFLILVVLII